MSIDLQMLKKCFYDAFMAIYVYSISICLKKHPPKSIKTFFNQLYSSTPQFLQ